MSENDPRFGYPIEYVKEHVLGCFEASKACAILPGKPHLYHVEFLKREDSTDIKDGSALPLDFYLQAHFSPCEEVTWYLHTRRDNIVYEGSVQVDDQFVADNEAGIIPDRRERVRLATMLPELSFTHTLADPLTEQEKDEYVVDATLAHHKRLSSFIYGAETGRRSSSEPTTCGCVAQLEKQNAREAALSVPTTPENSTESVTDTFGCNACAVVNSELPHSRACKARRSRFDKINKELNNGNQG